MFEQETQINYVKLMFAVCGGILMAGAVSLVFWLMVLDAAVDSANDQIVDLKDSIQDETSRARRATDARKLRQQEALEQQRINSKDGQTLSRKCREYSDFYVGSPSDYARQERDRACGNYQVFVRTGRLPRPKS